MGTGALPALPLCGELASMKQAIETEIITDLRRNPLAPTADFSSQNPSIAVKNGRG
jgi:hypothetical protein